MVQLSSASRKKNMTLRKIRKFRIDKGVRTKSQNLLQLQFGRLIAHFKAKKILNNISKIKTSIFHLTRNNRSRRISKNSDFLMKRRVRRSQKWAQN